MRPASAVPPRLTFHAVATHRAWSALLLLFLLLALLAGCARKVGYTPVPRGAVVLAFGDSVTVGVGAGPEENYPTRLTTLSGWEIRNYGISGDTAANAKSRIRAALDETQPALVIVELGGNDFLRRHPEAAVKEDLRLILQTAKQAGRPVALVGVPRLSLLGAAVGALSDSPIYAELADEENVVLVADVFASVLSTPGLKADAIHPNAEGYAVLTEGIAKALRKVGLLGA